MRKLIVQEFVTLDNFAAGLHDELDFMPQTTTGDWTDSVEQHQWDFVQTVDTMILGRRTYKMFAEYWPNATERMTPAINALNKFVCSGTLSDASWGETESANILRTDIPEQISELKKMPGKDIVIWGSLTLVQSLCETKLIDQYHFIVSPVILGTGKKLFPERQLDLEFGEAKVLEGGYLILKYAPV